MRKKTPTRYQLEASDDTSGRRIRFLASEVSLAEGANRTWVTVTRTGSFTDPRYGRFEITGQMLSAMVKNFEANTYGQDIFLDVAHEPEKGAAAKVVQLATDGNRLRALVEWTPYGLAAVRERGFRYLSADFYDDYIDNEAGKNHGPVLCGAGLTIRPVIKRLDPVQLSESANPSGPVLLSPGIVRQLTEHLETVMNKWLTELNRRLTQRKLSEPHTKALTAAFEAAAKNLGEDETALEALVKQLDESAAGLAAADPASPITLSVQTATDPEAINAAVAKALAERDTATRQLAESREAKVKLYDDALTAATGLSDATRTTLGEARDLITAEMSDDQVKRLAQTQIALGEQLEASRQLAAMGYQGSRSGSPHITVDESNSVKKLAESVRTGLLALGNDALRLPEIGKESPLVKRVLAEFDREHAPRLHREAKLLAGGVVDTSDTNLPASYQRQVIMESLSDLRILDLVGADVDPTQAATHSIPYETRDLSAVRNNGIVYEGQPIHNAGISQDFELAYIQQMKLALEQSNEVGFFTRANSLINWDSWGRNIASNARAIRELMQRRIANEMQRNADAYATVDVTAEDIEPQADGVRTTYKTAQFPIVRPHQVRDLKGNAVGTPENPIAVSYDGAAIDEWDGSGTQSAGTYYRVTNWNLGYFQLLDQAGVPVAAEDTKVFTVSYSYTSNIVKVDLDVPGTTNRERHLNKLLQSIGARKALLNAERFVQPNFALCSPVLHNNITDAEQFEWGAHRADSGITSAGTLEPVKGIPVWDTNAPAIDLGDERILLGRRGDFRYTIAKPFSIGAPFEKQVNGAPVGKKIAYGEEYSSLKVPKRLREGYTSIIAYSATARTAV